MMDFLHTVGEAFLSTIRDVLPVAGMMDFLHTVGEDFLSIIRDVLPVVVVILFFQLVILRRRLPKSRLWRNSTTILLPGRPMRPSGQIHILIFARKQEWLTTSIRE